MTENEVCVILNSELKYHPEMSIFHEALSKAVQALEEVQQYRQIGTVSTCRNAVGICKAMIESGINPDNITECIKFEYNLVQRGYDLKKLIEMIEKHKQQFQIGTVEVCQKLVEICKSMIERNITPENMEEYMKFEDECISKGFTFNSLLEAREKQTAKKPDYEGDGYSDGQLVYDTWICPCCGKHYEVDCDRYYYCQNCGQHIDWSDNE